MRVSENGRAFITSWEGDKLAAYKDGGGVLTIGRGHTGPDVHEGQTITQAQSDALFDADLAKHDITPLLLGCETNQNQFDAMTSLAFNIGLTRFTQSTVLKRHRQGNKIAAANAFLLWCYDNGRKVTGLENRRAAERQLYLKA